MIGFKHPLKCVESLAPITRLCWEMGWNEINGGNISWRLSNEHIDNVLKQIVKIDEDFIKLSKPQPTLDGEYFLVTGSGKYFRHAIEKTDEVFGIVQIKDGGNSYQKIWGFKGGGKPTSEFETHLTGHSIRKRQSKGREEVILHCHPPEFIILSFLMPLDSSLISLALWKTMPECIVFFPDGIRVVPPILPGTNKIADASAIELEKSRIISWSHHGIFVSEESPDAVFSLVETIEKASAMQRKIIAAGGAKQTISLQLLRELTDATENIRVCDPDILIKEEKKSNL